jgi:hypothetical protein
MSGRALRDQTFVALRDLRRIRRPPSVRTVAALAQLQEPFAA